MTDYEPLDLSGLCNAGVDVLGGQAQVPVGRQLFHGLPFLIGSPDNVEGRPFIAFGAGARQAPLAVSIEGTARQVIVAHRLLDSDLESGGPLGELIADYVFHLADGQAHRVPIRERFEIAIIPENPWLLPVLPFCAFPDNRPAVYPRYEGRWDEAGHRREEVQRATPRAYYLWVWSNPHPEQPVTSLEFIPYGPRFVVAGITLGHLDEHPFLRRGTSEVKIVLPEPADAAKQFGLEVDVDRGVATYPYALPSQSAEAFLVDPFKGWGGGAEPPQQPCLRGSGGHPLRHRHG